MRKFVGLLVISFVCLFFLPRFAHADSSANTFEYSVDARAFYWGANVSTPLFSSNSGGYGATVDVEFGKNSGLENWGFGAEFTSLPTGPRYTNTGGMFQMVDFAGHAGFPVSIGGGGFGLIVPGNFQMGGGKVKYFIPTGSTNFRVAPYVDYLSASGARSAIGGGVEADFNVSKNISIEAFLDYNNVSGNNFPTQTLLRYQPTVTYHLNGDKGVEIFVGYRAYNYTGYLPTNMNGFIGGVGGKW